MADMVSVEEVAEAMYKLVDESKGIKKWKATDLQKASIEFFGSDRCDKKLCLLSG